MLQQQAWLHGLPPWWPGLASHLAPCTKVLTSALHSVAILQEAEVRSSSGWTSASWVLPGTEAGSLGGCAAAFLLGLAFPLGGMLPVSKSCTPFFYVLLSSV